MGTAAVAPWKQLLMNAMQSNSHLKHSSYFQLATIGINGRPANRTVVFRGFQDNSDKIQINTDSRTHKIEDLKQCPFGEICWYFTDSWEQFRINGAVDVIDGSNPDPVKLQQREKAWFASSPRSRLQYVGPYPGLPSLGEQSSGESSLDNSTGPVDAFCLLVLNPEQVDYLNLKENKRVNFTTRQSDDSEKLWNSENINP
ncbi:Pyridoxal 5'-phosphate synthase [Heracleum sosnowskyi]|uniref:pyridoxal 5'-phosphate synthase n=1 Tax=Heracleum sosnowskyi TaxID=360622 RepID=A0AAD8MHF4_9APIA|nr:Pyridoxal 5'-phosphate synthase [Heracleum sosnowskyi]